MQTPFLKTLTMEKWLLQSVKIRDSFHEGLCPTDGVFCTGFFVTSIPVHIYHTLIVAKSRPIFDFDWLVRERWYWWARRSSKGWTILTESALSAAEQKLDTWGVFVP